MTKLVFAGKKKCNADGADDGQMRGGGDMEEGRKTGTVKGQDESGRGEQKWRGDSEE